MRILRYLIPLFLILTIFLIGFKEYEKIKASDFQILNVVPENASISVNDKLLIDSDTLSLTEELTREREKNRDSGNSGDAVEGITAFIEKREPNFE